MNTLDAFRAGRISAQVAIARLALSGDLSAIAAEPALAALANYHGLDKLKAMREAVDHAGIAPPEAVGRMFDAAVAASPEASVAAASLGDAGLLAGATMEIIGWLQARALLRPGMRVLDLGCGIGRIAAALAPLAEHVLGLEVSDGMLAEARRRVRAANVAFARTAGHGLPWLPWPVDLLLAVDVFPYLVQAGVAERHVADAARALAPGGALVVLNWSYRSVEQDRAEAAAWAERHGLALTVAGESPFAIWDALAFVLVAPEGNGVQLRADIPQTVDPWTEAMLAGDWQRAWAISDAVLRTRDRRTRDDPALPYHLRWVWDGTPPDGRDVLVRCYHGLGDTLQFCRFLPALRRRARRVTLEVQPELAGLLAGFADRVVPFDVAAPLPPAELDLEIMELGHALRLAPRDVPSPYIASAAWPEFAGLGAIGVCWEAGGWDPARSLPLQDLMAALPGRLVSLQRGPAGAQATGARFVNPRDEDGDVARTAGSIAAARLVVTVDTMVAHLAGAMGRPGVVLLKQAADWRWMRGPHSAWYPSLTLLRQERAGDWSAALDWLMAQARVSPAAG